MASVTAVFFLLAALFSPTGFAAPNAPDLSAKAKAAFDKGRFEKAAALYAKAASRDAKNPEIRLWLGRARDALADFDGALLEYAATLDLKPPEPHVVYNDIGVTYAKMRRHADAIAAFQKCVALKPVFALGHYNLGKAFYAAGDKAKARALFGKLKAMGEIDMAQSLWEQVYR